MALAVVSSSLLFFLEERVLADANKKANELEDTIHDRPHHTVNIANRNWLVGANDRIYYYDLFDAQHAEIQQPDGLRAENATVSACHGNVRPRRQVPRSRVP